MILVFGATGNVGAEVARQLIASGLKPRLLVRRPEKAREFRGDAEIVRGDLSEESSLLAAMKGVERMFLASSGPNGTELEIGAIDAAKKSGVKHVVKLSVIGAERPELTFSKWHAKTERHLIGSGLRWTMLRPGNFMSNALAWAESIKAEGKFYQPTGKGRWAAIDPSDIGAVAAEALTGSVHEGKAYTLTGPESMDASAYAAQLSSLLNKPVQFVDTPMEATKTALTRSGMPPSYVEALLDLFAAMKAGRLDLVTDTVEKITGRKATTFETWVRRKIAAFKVTQNVGTAR